MPDPGSGENRKNCGCVPGNGTRPPSAFTNEMQSRENTEDQMLTTRPDHGLRSRYNADTKNPILVFRDCSACGLRFVPGLKFDIRPAVSSRPQASVTPRTRLCESCGWRYYLRSRIKYAAYEWMKSQPCVDCHQVFTPAAMEFDHKPGYEKVGQLSEIVRKVGLESFVDEIVKCDVVCANCHRVRTEQRRSNAEA